MANRSYLYSSQVVPSPETKLGATGLNGISEWNYDIPVTFKILLSSNPRKCRSSIWEVPDEIAIAGDYDPGVERLLKFLDRISIPEVTPLKEEARSFLTDSANKGHYFVLECGELFEMEDEPLSEQNESLLEEIQNIDRVMDDAIAKLPKSAPTPPKSGGFFSRLLGKKPPSTEKQATEDTLCSLGLGHWSNILYYDLRKKD
ncbi:MAG TPA: hypothetical protein VLM40_21355 [Gemmata sp.]|nr:hypothetical protein [Gemmata sp.]